MSQDIYKKLAEKLDDMPNRYPATESGVELRLLEKLFEPEEAALAAEMFFEKGPASDIAARANLPEKESRRTLKNMVRKKIIRFSKRDHDLVFGLMPFVVGFYETSLPRMDQELATLFEQYFQESGGEITGHGLSVHRVIPVEESLDFEMEIFPYEKASNLLENAKSWAVRNCICRVQKQLIGDPCDHPLESCLVFAPIEGAFDTSDVDRAITKEEALKILIEAEDAGLVHTTGNYQGPHDYICNCCTCSCGILRGVAEFNKPSAITKSDFLVVIDEDLCVSCGDCIERCQFNALNLGDLVCEVDPGSCVGCGLCVPACPEGAMVLIRRPEGELLPPPENIKTWGEVRFER
ncbi:MAG: 4Fe-4S binding protein [Anaerolineales bacterium]|nr:4Fe-4S binding protein [Anaerolineales bacterium]